MCPSNFYFDQYENRSEQELLDDLIVESIEITGMDMFYIPRTLDTPDKVFGESPIASFNSAYMIPVYIENVMGFSGEGNFLSRFGLEIRDQVVFTIAMRTFQDEVAAEEQEIALTRPREGDLLYFPLRKAVFQILFVDKFQMYYPLGSLHTWKLTCELFEYSHERFNTGMAEIDSLEQKYSADLLLWSIRNEDDDYYITEVGNDIYVSEKYNVTSPEPFSDSDAIQAESNTFIDLDFVDPFSEGNI